jgi:FdhD protein
MLMKAGPVMDDAALKQVAVQKWQDGRCDAHDDAIAVEVPVALEYNGISHAVMLASPADLEDFALGFSLSEGILGAASELLDCEVAQVAHGIQVQMRIPAQQFVALKEKRRNLTGRTGCGLCGAETLQQAIRRPLPVAQGVCIAPASLHAGMAAMQVRQPLQQSSGATHAAAWMNADGSIGCVREDVGRHNALDKLIGALARTHFDAASGALLITSRASYEMVQKAATLGIGFIAAISAPTSLATELAQEAGVTLVGFVRPHSHVVYAHGRRLLHEPD